MKKIWNYIKSLFGPTIVKEPPPTDIIMTMKNGKLVTLDSIETGTYESSFENGVLIMTLKKDQNSKP